MDLPHLESVEQSIERQKRFERLLKGLSPYLKLEIVFGMNRFRWNGRELTSPKKSTKFLSILVSTSMVVAFVILRIYSTASLRTLYKFDGFMELSTFLFYGQYWFCCVLTATSHNKSNIKIMKGIYNADKALRINTTYDDCDRSRREDIIIVLFLIAFHTIVSWYHVTSGGIITINGLLLLIIHLFQDLEMVIFCKLMNMLKARLSVLNDQLIKITLKCKNNAKAIDNKKDDVIMKVYNLATVYDEIGEVCSSINDVFNFYILTTLTSAFAHIIVVQWRALHFYATKEEFALNMINATVWCVKYLCMVATMCFYCERLLTTRDDTKTLVNELIMDYDWPARVRTQAKVFMELYEAWDLRISVYDMFFVDGTLIFKFVSVCTTYLIVVIQIYHFV